MKENQRLKIWHGKFYGKSVVDRWTKLITVTFYSKYGDYMKESPKILSDGIIVIRDNVRSHINSVTQNFFIILWVKYFSGCSLISLYCIVRFVAYISVENVSEYYRSNGSRVFSKTLWQISMLKELKNLKNAERRKAYIRFFNFSCILNFYRQAWSYFSNNLHASKANVW